MKTPQILSTVALLTLLTLNANAQGWLTNGLVAYYPLDGNVNDASGFGINGVMYNVSPTNNRFGQPSSAIMFQGTNGSYVDMGAPTSLQFTGDFTVTAWVVFSGGTLNPRIVSYGADCGYELLTGEASSIRHWGVNLACVKFSAVPTSPPDEWHFVAVCRSGNDAKIFVNGEFVATNAVAATPAFPGNLNLGRKSIQDEFETRNFWGGAMDEMRFYNRALSSNELAQLYALDFLCSPHKATATAQIVNGFIVGAIITDAGCGYTNPPLVMIQGGGSGATATAVISNGVVVGLNITDAGSGYSTNPPPRIVIASPPFEPTVSIRISKVKVTQNIVLGRNYVLEASTNLTTWTATGPQFNAQSESVTNEFDVDDIGRFFRIREVP